EMATLGLRPPLIGFGLTMIGPLLLQVGTEEQKRQHLPPIVRGELRWCQGYSEPGAGSDLASLQTRAVRDGDVFIVNGQKIWTSYADKADWMFLLVRTDPEARKHAGITFLLMDMDSPGVTARPIKLISGASPFCETFLTDVRVPVRNVVGRVNEGWAAARAGDVDLQVLRHRAEPAPARPGGPHRGTPGPRLGGRGLRRRGAQARARLAPLARQLDRGRHVGGPAEHHRQARARPARLMALVLTEEQELLG